jgi:tRNA threonylcarbamoyladenosine biosynthesis protein TsaB
MKIIGVDTTSKILSIGAYDNGKVYEYNLEVGIRLSSLLAPTLERLMHALKWSPANIDYFACGLGPGSFTGMRVGIAAVKGLAWSLNKPIVGISTLDILAKGVEENNSFLIPVIDAKRNLFYCCIYKTKDGILKKLAPYMLLGKEEFLKKIRAKSIIFGDGVNLCKEELNKNLRGVTILDKEYWYPRGRNIIALALERIKQKKFSSASSIKPIYIYPKECQVRIS